MVGQEDGGGTGLGPEHRLAPGRCGDHRHRDRCRPAGPARQARRRLRLRQQRPGRRRRQRPWHRGCGDRCGEFLSGLAQGIVWATDHGARVINASLGGPFDDPTLSAATEYARVHGVVVVAAAGNEGGLTLDYPAALPNVLSVGASDQNDQLYSFSNSGAQVAAPGENSTTASGGGYVSFLGTSSAAPVVSGIAGLAFSVAPGATPAQVEQAIETNAIPIPGVVSGRVDAYATLRALAPGLVLPGEPQPGSSGPAPAGAMPRATKIVTGRLRRGKIAGVTLTTGAGLLQATVNARKPGRAKIRLRLLAAGRVTDSARGAGRASLRTRVREGAYRLVVSTTSRRPLFFVLTIRYPAAGA
ncbi:MAG: hypothetical protein E6G21_05385 [Actinobacteria bacterium]|nr:MAG: hypothetical protein E6G21_05385 [Actinomycetota bacterium]